MIQRQEKWEAATRRELDEQNLSRVSNPLGEKTSKILVFSLLYISILGKR